MNLTPQQIKYIDSYLQFLNVKFIDVRVELIDHLASEFENNSQFVLLEDFLRTKKAFVRTFEKNLHSKKHWGYQKRLFKRILNFFVSPNGILISLMLGFLIYTLTTHLSDRVVSYLFLSSVLIPQFVHLYIYKKPKEMHQQIQSARYMLSIMSFPSIFLYSAFPLFENMPEKSLYFMGFWFVAIISNLAGLQEVIICKREVLKQYVQMVKS